MRTTKVLAVAAMVWALGLVAAGGTFQRGQTPPRPNIVVLFTDDMGYGDLSSYGHPTIRTPQLDRMAREGIRLTSFYAAASVCTPSRFGLLTGRYAPRSGAGLTTALLHAAKTGLPAGEVTIAEALKARGYRTAIIGKWHLGHLPEFNPTRHGFDLFYGLPYSHDIMPPWVEGAPPVPLYSGETVVEQPVERTTLTRRYTEQAVQFIRSAKGQPFFLYLAHNMPHLPVAVSDPFAGRSRGGLYGDTIEEIDWSAGEVLAALGAAGIDENTIVVFTSDNGPWLNAGPRMMQGGIDPWDVGSPGSLRGSKGTTYEAGFRVPGIVRWPRTIPAGQESAAMASALDLFPTFAAIAGATVPADRPLDGGNILPLLTGRGPAPPREFFYFQGRALQAVRSGSWKFRLTSAGAGQPPVPELFDLEKDPGERYNVAAAHPDVVERLRARLTEFGTDVASAAKTNF